MSIPRFSPLSVGPLRAFEAVSRTLNFRLAAEELHLTQPAVSRQIKALEAEVGALLLERDTRRVRLTAAGVMLLQALGPWLASVDVAVRRIRQSEGRHVATISTFASLASLWLIPRLPRLSERCPVDVRVLAHDQIVPGQPEDTGVDVVLRYCRRDQAPANAVLLFEELLAPVASPGLLEATATNAPLRRADDLAAHTIIEDFDRLPSTEYRSWFHWLAQAGLPQLQPRRWLYFNLAHQQVDAALRGQGVALGRLPMIVDALEDGRLVEPFRATAGTRLAAPYAYWLIAPRTPASEGANAVRKWLLDEARRTRAAVESYVKPGREGGGRRAMKKG